MSRDENLFTTTFLISDKEPNTVKSLTPTQNIETSHHVRFNYVYNVW